MTKTLLSLLVLCPLTLRAQAEAPKAEALSSSWTATGNAGLYSDYRFRGFTQTAYKPSFQGGFDLAHSSGLYVGSWNANVEQSLYRGATLEMDLYGGYKFKVAKFGFDLGAITCRYPTHANTGNVGEVHHDELYLGLTYRFLSLKYSHQLSNYFGLGDGTGVDTKGGYLDLGVATDLGRGWGVYAHCGRQTIQNAIDPAVGLKAASVDDYKVGVTKEVKGWVASATWAGTSRKDYFTTGTSAPESGGREAMVFGLSKIF